MRPTKSIAAVAAVLLAALGAVSVGQSATAAPAAPGPHSVRVCPEVKGEAACMARVRTDITPHLAAPGLSVAGLTPTQLRAAYSLTATGSAAQTIGIVDANDDPNAEADLAVYRSNFGLPPCTTANGCFHKYNLGGPADPGWAEEISLDVDMASAICPNCHIALIEASSASFAALGAAENYAVSTAHATVISNSYGGGDTPDTSAPYYNHPGVPITASSGDSGYGVEFPASSRYVTAVGGTSLHMSGNTRVSETAWSGAGSGCSAYNPALTGQASFGTGCARRAVADVSAVADPNTGVAVYDTYGGVGGWLVFGGTSVASPIIASVFALAGNGTGTTNNWPYTHYSGNFNDITSGSNGSCSPSQLCTARVGWDGPTGLGTPRGTGGF
jgi:subtilase family serine protease